MITLDHLELSTANQDGMRAFYDRVLLPLGITRRVDGVPAGYGDGVDLPFWIGNGANVTRNAHFAFAAKTRLAVQTAFEAAAANGGTKLREPALHPHVGPNYYAAYACDPDGHLVEFVCRAAD